MKITKRFCDRCGREIKHGEEYINMGLERVRPKQFGISMPIIREKYELCEECAKKIVEEIKRGEEVNSKFGNKKLPPKKK